jgi:RNA polymerase sigma factor (TIGR02999 family)
MNEVMEILTRMEQGDQHDAAQLLPLVYDQLRCLAAQKLAREVPGQTLQATALVHEAFVRLVKPEKAQNWDGRGHFFAAAAEAMRRILVEKARQKQCSKHGGNYARQEGEIEIACTARPERLLALDEALDRLAAASSQAAELVKLRYFAGFSNAEAATLLGVSPRKANQIWAYARAWLREDLGADEEI